MIARKTFGATGAQVPVLGQGTWQMERDDRRSAVEALRAGIELGMTHVDTAELYGDGRVEELVAEAIAGKRDQIYLVSKVMPSNASRRGTVQACEQSLKRLRTDHLDCYLLHWPGSHPLPDTIAAFEQLRESGKIRAWGVSNFDVRDLKRALESAGPNKIACNQVLYHLEQRDIEHEVLPWCRTHAVAVVGYSPFGAGRFRARGEGAKALEQIAKNHRATPRQVALAFLAREPELFAIPKTSHAQHTRENASAGGLELDAAEIAQIDAVYPLPPKRRGIPTS